MPSSSIDADVPAGTASQIGAGTDVLAGTNPEGVSRAGTQTKFLGEPVVNGLVPIERLLTVREVARRLGGCRATVYKLAASGALPHVRIGGAVRIPPGDLAALLANRRR
jgi:excisionase family DNA binding protein